MRSFFLFLFIDILFNPQPLTTMTFEQAKRFQKIFQWVRFLILVFFIAVLYFVLASAA